MSTGWSERQSRIRTGVISALAGLMLVSGTPAFSAGEAKETVPSGFGYAGRLRRDGALFTGQTVWRLAIVDAAGRVLWTNDGSGQIPPVAGVAREVAGGVVNLAVGQPQVAGEAMQPVPSAVFAAPRTYLRAWVAAPTTAQPEELIASEQPVPHAQAFTSVPYSHRAAEAGRAESAGRADVASGLAPLAVGQPVEVQGDLRVHGRVLDDSSRVGAASSPPDEDKDDHGKRGRVTFDTVTTRHLIVTDSVSLPGVVVTSTVTQVQTLVVQSSATFTGPLAAVGGVKVGTGSIVLGQFENTGTINTILFTGGGGSVRTDAGNTLNLVAAGDPADQFAQIRIVGTSLTQNRTVGLDGMTVVRDRLAVGTGFLFPFPPGGAPSAQLQLRGQQGAALDVLRVEGLAGTQVSPFVTVNSVGNTGIGTVAPGARLDIQQPSTSGLLLRAASGSPLVDRFTVDGLGNATVGGNLTVASPGVISGNGSGLTNVAAATVADGAVTAAKTALPAINPSTGKVPGLTAATLDSVDGSALTSLNASQLTSGTMPDAALSPNVARRDQPNTFAQAQAISGPGAMKMRLGALDDRPDDFRITVNSDLTFNSGKDVATASAWHLLLAPRFDDFRVIRIAPLTNVATPLLILDGPSGRLLVQGDVRAEGHIIAHGGVHVDGIGDVAERFLAAEPLQAGEAVVPSQDGSGEVVRSTGARNPGFLGVVSDGTGLVLADKTSGPPIALVGRVRARLSAENGSITPGTPLTTSSTPGHLMKADGKTPVGAVVGVALGRLDSGTGLIEIVLR